jgi:two-component system response regulator QseB
MRILLVEDDKLLGESVRKTISAEGYAIDWLTSGENVAVAVTSNTYDLILLDQRLPGKSGIEILRELRAIGIQTPVLLLTACDAVSDKVAGLDAGADDYLTKPFDTNELFARIRSLLRRNSNKDPLLAANGLELDPATRRVRFHGNAINDLTVKEFALLEILMRNRGRFITKARLLEGINNWDEEVESNTIEVYISRLRRRLGHGMIETLRGVGYKFV